MGVNASAQSQNSKQQNYPKKSSAPPQPTIKAFHTKDQWKTYFDSCKSSSKLVVIDFTATWCGPCKSMEPILKELCEKYTDMDFVKLDVDELPDVAAEFGVQAMPTFLLMKKGDLVGKVVGAKKVDLKAMIVENTRLV